MSEAALLDALMPSYDLRERHSIPVRAGAAATYDALRHADLGAPVLFRLLMTLRAIPAVLAGRGSLRERVARLRRRSWPTLTLDRLDGTGFALLGERPPRELVLGLEGRFWTPRGDLRRTSAEHFRAPPAPGTARAGWSFVVEPVDGSRSRLVTETRVLAADAPSRRKMRAYWLLIRPGSGLIRRAILRAVKRRAESGVGR